MKACIILHNMIVEDEQDSYLEYSYDQSPAAVVTPVEVLQDGKFVGPHPDTRLDADIRWQFQQNCTSASAPAPASGYPLAAAGIRAGILGYPPSKGPATDRLEGLPSSRPSPLAAAGILWDTRIPASNLRKRGHPHLLAGIRQRITGIRDGYPSTISTSN
ncbi:hypothetical protein PGT21_011397 [Puccinia graminis f. sp. tritici]|uniref:Uncharacterized protein n=1 Tax=Puccinia graminis f. sp. tritici TaxID=56615 RepID=A0A5B0MAS2_PUCGR|nr:hypothetical protein PGT21_011397 [Puccinia graminis f. sp. tritici]